MAMPSMIWRWATKKTMIRGSALNAAAAIRAEAGEPRLTSVLDQSGA